MARPDFDLISRNATEGAVVCHLTYNFNKNAWSDSKEAFEFTGHVKINLNPGDSLNGYRFGFIQFMRQRKLDTVYAGKTSKEGCITIDRMKIIKDDYFLDCAETMTIKPFARPTVPPFAKFNEQEREQIATFGDQPMSGVPTTVFNDSTDRLNYLAKIQDEREACTIFTVLDPSMKFQHLAHVQWTLRYEFNIKWRGGKLHKASSVNLSKFDVGSGVLGPPEDPVLAWLSYSCKPDQRTYHNEMGRALPVIGSPVTNFKYSTWPSSIKIGNDFFK